LWGWVICQCFVWRWQTVAQRNILSYRLSSVQTWLDLTIHKKTSFVLHKTTRSNQIRTGENMRAYPLWLQSIHDSGHPWDIFRMFLVLLPHLNLLEGTEKCTSKIFAIFFDPCVCWGQSLEFAILVSSSFLSRKEKNVLKRHLKLFQGNFNARLS
jgi:hypothetical protein